MIGTKLHRSGCAASYVKPTNHDIHQLVPGKIFFLTMLISSSYPCSHGRCCLHTKLFTETMVLWEPRQLPKPLFPAICNYVKKMNN